MIISTVPKSIYITFASLMLLLLATIAVSFIPLGTANTFVAMLIAVVKMMLVAVVFMNLLGSSGTVRLAAAAGLLWLSFAVVCVMADYHSRGWGEAQSHGLVEIEQVQR